MRGALIRPIQMRGTAALFAVNAGLLFIVLTLRALLLGMPHPGHGAILLRSVQLLDVTAALILPMLSSFTLIILPYLSHRVTRYAAERAGLN